MSQKSKNVQGSYTQILYDVDLVLCIDATESMTPVLDKVKENAVSLYKDVLRASEQAHKHIRRVRVRVIVFRDYISDGEYAMQATDFMELPKEMAQFVNVVDGIIAGGGGDEPEDGLEALAYAIRSDWTPQIPGVKRRQIIAVWSDAPTHEIGFARNAPEYDENLPETFSELTDWWGYPPVGDDFDDDDSDDVSFMHYESKRLVMFTPDADMWNTLEKTWDNTIHYKSVAGQGLKEFDYKDIISLIVNSI